MKLLRNVGNVSDSLIQSHLPELNKGCGHYNKGCLTVIASRTEGLRNDFIIESAISAAENG